MPEHRTSLSIHVGHDRTVSRPCGTAIAILNAIGSFVHNFSELAEREGIEPSSARKRADGGFEDREDHQAPITLRDRNSKTSARLEAEPCGLASALGPHRLHDGIRIGELSRLQLGVDLLPIDTDLKHAAT